MAKTLTTLGYGNAEIELGAHLSYFFSEREYAIKTLPPIIREGLINNEKCLYASDELSVRLLKAELKKTKLPSPSLLKHKNQLVLVSNKDYFFDKMEFDGERLLNKITSFIQKAVQQEGWEAARVIIDMLWLLENTPGAEKLMNYEQLIDRVLTNKHFPGLVICQYDISRLSGKLTLDLISNHSLLFVGDLAQEVPYFTKLKALSYRDSITGLYNYRYFRERLKEEFARAERYRGSCTLLLLDINNFKKINESLGYLKSNEILWEIAKLLKKNIRKIDLIVRYGSDEFAILMPETTKKNADLVIRRIVDIINNNKFLSSYYPRGKKVTLTYGLATFPIDSREPEELIACVEKDLNNNKLKKTKQTAQL